MRLRWRTIAALSAFALPTTAALPLPHNAWSIIAKPTPGPSLAIGSTAHGCLSGARELPVDGIGYEVIRLSRHRNFGHIDMVGFVEALGRKVHAAGLPLFYVGDMAQPRGGPLPFGHASHQTGLDVDIWFTGDTKPGLPLDARENPELPSMVLPDGEINPAKFGPRQVKLLELAVSGPAVDRVFVNPSIKLALCRGFGGATQGGRDWLHKLRPWYGHDDHFHVRLACPEGSPACEPQKPIPQGDGCDAALEDWALHQAPPALPKRPTVPEPYPAACEQIRTE
jgi:penicillin-insensitive murein endopeptidase